MNWLDFVRDLFGFPSISRTKAFLLYLTYYIVINLISFYIMKLDKKLARRGKHRIPENVIFSIAILGGGAGANIAMNMERRKRKNRSFSVGIPIITVFNVAVLLFLMYILYI